MRGAVVRGARPRRGRAAPASMPVAAGEAREVWTAQIACPCEFSYGYTLFLCGKGVSFFWQKCVYLERTNGTPAGSARAHATRGAAAGCSVQRAVRHAHVRSRTAHAPPRSRTRRAVQIMRGIILNMIQESFMKKATSLNAHSLRNLTVLRNTHLNNTQPPETSSSAHRTGRRRA